MKNNFISIALLKPETGRGKSVLSALRKRQTIREISRRKLPLQILSNLLWSVSGQNREKGPFGAGGLTSASASNSEEIELYAALEDGIYFFDPFKHILDPVVEGDFRNLVIGRGQSGY